ncbi:MAG: RDD family protein [Candidatus Woesearchaeota archaeon]
MEHKPGHYASFWMRILAGIIDFIVLLGLGIVTSFIIGFIIGFISVLTESAAGFLFLESTMFIIGFSIVLSWLYVAILESSRNQATLGQMALGLQITDLHERRISFLRASARFFSSYLSAFILLVGYFMILFTPRRQALHDVIADTLVIHKKHHHVL